MMFKLRCEDDVRVRIKGQATGPKDSPKETFSKERINLSSVFSGLEFVITHRQIYREDFYCRLLLNLDIWENRFRRKLF